MWEQYRTNYLIIYYSKIFLYGGTHSKVTSKWQHVNVWHLARICQNLHRKLRSHQHFLLLSTKIMKISHESCRLRHRYWLAPLTLRRHSAAFARAPGDMYCLQWLIPVLLIPKPVNPALVNTHVMFMVLYLIGFFLERKPCTVCSVVFLAAVILICYSGIGNCLFWATQCEGEKYDT